MSRSFKSGGTDADIDAQFDRRRLLVDILAA
jgi:hypothetical protein